MCDCEGIEELKKECEKFRYSFLTAKVQAKAIFWQSLAKIVATVAFTAVVLFAVHQHFELVRGMETTEDMTAIEVTGNSVYQAGSNSGDAVIEVK